MIDAMGFVTAGGASSRMGTDKALLELDGRPMIEHVITALAPAVTGVAIIANSPAYESFGLPVFSDAHRGIGPLEAIRTALTNSDTSRLILVGCDLPFVSQELFQFLLSLSGNHRAVVPQAPDGELEPLCAIYYPDALTEVTKLIEEGQRKVRFLFDRLPTRFVRFEELQHLAGSALFFENINTTDDYLRARKNIRSIPAGDRDRS